LHQVIEHAHANTVTRFRKWLDDHAGDEPFAQVMQYVPIIEGCFKEGNTVEMVRKGVDKLKRVVYKEVIAAKGGHIAKVFR
jgi:hypothetical protein